MAKSAAGYRGHLGGGVDSPKNSRFVTLGNFALFHFAVEVLRNRVHGVIEEARFDVAQNYAVAGASEHVRDAVAHGAGAEDCNGADCVNGHRVSRVGGG